MSANISMIFSRSSLKSSQQTLFISLIIAAILIVSPLSESLSPRLLFLLSIIPAYGIFFFIRAIWGTYFIQRESLKSGDRTIGAIPQRDIFAINGEGQISDSVVDKTLVGFDTQEGAPVTIDFEELLGHVSVSAGQAEIATGVVENLILQQISRGGAHGALVFDASPNGSTLSHLAAFVKLSGRVEDLVVIDPGHSPHTFNPLANCRSTDEKIRFVLEVLQNSRLNGDLPAVKDKLVDDCVTRMIKTLDSFGRNWHLGDLAAALEHFSISYSILRTMAQTNSNTAALLELGHIGSAFRTSRGSIDTEKLSQRVSSVAEQISTLVEGDLRELVTARNSTLDIYEALELGQIVYVRVPSHSRYSIQALVSALRQELDLAMIDRVAEEPHRTDDPFLCCLIGFGDAHLSTWRSSLELASQARVGFIYTRDSLDDLSDNSESFRNQLLDQTHVRLRVGFGNERGANVSFNDSSRSRSSGSGVVAGLGRPHEVRTRTLEPLPRVSASQRVEISAASNRTLSSNEPYFLMKKGRDAIYQGRLTLVELESKVAEELFIEEHPAISN